MIGKRVKGKSFKGCVSYVMEKQNARLLASEGVLEVDTKSIINSLYMQSLLNTNLTKSVGHISLSFAKEDEKKLTDSMMIQLAKEYMKEMKIENTQYIIVCHNDTEHPHCHLVFNRLDNHRKTISDKNDQYRNEKVCKSLKEKYGLTFGEGKAKINTQKLKGTEKTKHEIYHSIKGALAMAKNWKQFEHILSLQGIGISYKNKGQTDEVQGISFKKGIKELRQRIEKYEYDLAETAKRLAQAKYKEEEADRLTKVKHKNSGYTSRYIRRFFINRPPVGGTLK